MRLLPEPERKRLIAALDPRAIAGHDVPELVQTWLVDLGVSGRPEALIAGSATFSQLCSRLGFRMHPGTRERFAPPDRRTRPPGLTTRARRS